MKITKWVFSALMFSGCLVYGFSFTGILFALLGIGLLPIAPVEKIVNKVLPDKKILRGIIVAVVFIIGIAIAPNTAVPETPSPTPSFTATATPFVTATPTTIPTPATTATATPTATPTPVTTATATPTATPTPVATATATPKATPTPAPTPGQQADGIKVHYIDVGQGDSIFFELTSGRCMLIDAGEKEYGPTVINYIEGLGYSTIDYLVITHPHTDHMGAMQQVVENFDIGKIYMPQASNNTKTFENLLLAIQAKGESINAAKAGVNILSEEGLLIEIIAPCGTGYESLNDYSAVVKLTYGSVKFLFMGDAETTSEKEIQADLSCDIVKVGHHGSTTSSGAVFVNKTGADYAIIQVGAGNSYGHPKDTIVSRWENAGATVLRTDLEGTIVVTTDGSQYTITSKGGTKTQDVQDKTEDQQKPQASWVLNTNTKKIHYSNCRHVSSIKPENYAESDLTIAELEAQGYSTCGTCKPKD